jgi:hypothetical protein
MSGMMSGWLCGCSTDTLRQPQLLLHEAVVAVGDRAVFAMADHSYLITLATYNPRGHFAA